MSTSKKEKVVSAKGDEAEEMVLNYLIQQNRPYGATDLSANLKNRVSKAQAQKALASLHEKGEIMGKTYGKSTVYCAIQKEDTSDTAEDPGELEAEIKELQSEETKLKEDLKVLAIRKAELLRTPKTDELESVLLATESKCVALEKTLASLRNSSTPISASALEKVSVEHARILKIAQARAKIARDVEGMLCEMFDKRPKVDSDLEAAWDQIGGEWGGEAERKLWNDIKLAHEKELKGKAAGGRK